MQQFHVYIHDIVVHIYTLYIYIYIKKIYKAKNHAQHTSTDCSELVREGLYVL